ncbi:MAG: HD domain-containing protein [Sporomusaceae bacterium]|nr:HD domain-containing protein [Sporomusaceae bacterium]
MQTITTVLQAMLDYYRGDAKRISHFLKVHSLAKLIGELERLDAATQEILEIAALTHDIGIKNSELRYQSSAGHYQQLEGPPEAQKLLQRLAIDPAVIERVCWLIAHHHTYHAITGADYQILVEADFLVNIFEDQMTDAAIRSVREKIFVTGSGRHLLETMYAAAFSR